MESILIFFNDLRENAGAIWVENDGLVFSAPKRFQNETTRNFISGNKPRILTLLKENGIFSKETFQQQLIIKDSTVNYYPLSPAQERLWFIEQFEEGTNAYHIPDVYQLESGVRKEGIAYALRQIVFRHEVLRSYIRQNDELNYAVQVPGEEPLAIDQVTLSDKDEMKREMKKDINHPFHLSDNYPIRVKFYTIETDENLEPEVFLLINIHHIARDGWSNHIFNSEMSAYYEAWENADSSFQLPPLAIQYKDYALWQKTYLTGEVVNQQLQYWKQKISNFQPLDFPADFSRPAQTNYQGANVSFQASKATSHQLRELALKLGVSLNSVMLSAFNILLGKYTGQMEIVTGSPTANRQHRQTENLIGFFVNTQVNRAFLSEQQSFEQLVKEVYNDQIEAQAYQDLPFARLVDELKIERDPARHPIFQIIFEVQNFGRQGDGSDSKRNYLNSFPLDGLYEIERFDLSVFIDASQDELYTHISYASTLYKKSTMEQFARHFNQLLSLLAVSYQEPYSKMGLLSEQEVEAIIYQRNKTDKTYPGGKTILDLFSEQAVASSERPALLFEGKYTSYAKLNQESDKLAAFLIQNYNIKPNDCIGLMLNRSDNMLIAIFAILKAGAAYVAVDPAYPVNRKKYILEDTSTQVLITQSDYLFDIDFFSGNLFAIDLQLETIDVAISLPPVEITPSNLAYILYTSGTTGKPKGVMIPHSAVVNYINNVNEVFLSSVKIVDFSTSIAFDLTVTTTIAPLLLGKTIAIYGGELSNAEMYIQHLIDNKVDFLKSTPSLLANLPHEAFKGYKLKQAFIGGEKLTEQQLQHIAHYVDSPVDEYGPTEATVGTTFIEKGKNGIVKGIGRPYHNYKLYVLDKQLIPVPQGVSGELYIGGAGLALGYLNKPELSSERFIPNPFATDIDLENGYTRLYKTGDLVRWLSDGTLEYIGRNDEQVKIRGYRIELGEIESCLQQISGIQQAYVLARQRAVDNTRFLVAYYSKVRAEETLSVQTIKDALLQQLPEYMVPAHFIELKEFPLTINGKLDKNLLPDPEQTQLIKEYVPPVNEIQTVLCTIWQAVLGIERVGITENFFAIGGDSILSIQVSSRIRQMGYNCQVKDIFDSKTIEQLALCLSRKKTEVVSKTEQGVLKGELEILPIQQWFFNNVDTGNLEKPWHWNQSFLIHINTESVVSKVESVISELVKYHDILRVSYVKEVDIHTGKYNWKQVYRDSITLPELKTLNVHTLTAEQIEDTFTRWQSNFSVEAGYLFQVGYLHGYPDGSACIFLAFHHLLIDTVSWRIITEDIKTLFNGKALPPKGSSYRQWAEVMKQYPLQHSEEENYWREQLTNQTDRSDAPVLHDPSYKTVILSKTDTTELLNVVPKAYNTRINDLLLTAVSYALQEINGSETQGITLEGHGRENIDSAIDHSRTLGWFTTMYPVKMELKKTLAESISSVKETLLKIPNNGVGFGAFACLRQCTFGFNNLAPVSFNYLGQFENTQEGNYKIITESGVNVHPENADHYQIKIGGLVIEGAMELGVMTRYGEQVTQALAAALDKYLHLIIQHCKDKLHAEGPGHTPVDFPLVKISRELLNQIERQAYLKHNEIEAIFPANSLQQGFIYHALDQEEDDAYRVQVLFDYHGKINLPDYVKAWEYCILQYPSLRTAFNWDEELVQIVYKRASLKYVLHDLSHIQSAEERDKAIDTIQVADRLQKFDLADPGLFRIHIIKQRNDLFTLLKNEHHSIADGWSWSLQFSAVHKYYEQLAAGQKPEISEDVAYCKAQEYIATNKAKSQKYWHDVLGSLKSNNEINALLSKPVAERQIAINGTTELEHDISDKLYGELKQLCAREGITVNVLVQFAWHKLLQVFNSADKTIVGTTVSGRDLPISGIEQSVGLYINTLPLVVDWESENTVKQQLHHIQQQLILLNASSTADLALLQKNDERLFNTLFVFENYPLTDNPEDSGKISFRGTHEKVSYPLNLLAYDHDEALTLKLKFDEQYLEIQKARTLLGYLENVFVQIAAAPEVPHNKINLLTAADKNTLLYEWNKTQKEFKGSGTVIGLFEQQAVKTPHKIAIAFGTETLTYKELDERSNQLARYIQASALPETVAAICIDRSLEMIVGIVAVLKAGLAYTPVDPSFPADRISYMLQDTAASIVLSKETISAKVLTHETESRVITIDLNNQSIYQGDASSLKTHLLPENLAYVIYTSGTTGKPKGVMLEHRNLYNLVFSQKESLGINSDLKVLQYASLVFDASVWEIFSALVFGAELHIVPDEIRADADSVAAFMQRYEINMATLPPALLNTMPLIPMPALHTLIVAGESCPSEVMEKWSGGRKLINAYGPTESTVCATLHHYTTGDLNTNIGKPIANASIYILDAKLNPLPVGAIGELYIGGSGVARGYLNQNVLTSERFIKNPFASDVIYRTGDIARWLPDGSVEYIGRNDSQVKIRGYRIETTEIEQQILKIEEVKQAYVHVVSRKTESAVLHYLVAYYVLHASVSLSEEGIQHKLSEYLPEYMLPQTFIKMDAFPLTINGKIDVKALPLPELERDTDVFTRPANELEKQLTEVYATILGLKPEQISTQQNFFKMGGNSILSIRLKRTLNQFPEFKHISIADLFNYNTIQKLMQSIQPGQLPEYHLQHTPVNTAMSHEIAIIGMSGAFSGSKTIAEFWKMISEQREGIEFHDKESCIQNGVPEALIANPDFIPVRAKMDGKEAFDPNFWNLSPNEAKQLDPQIRKFLEHCWAALESSGYIAQRSNRNIGVFAGSGEANYFYENILNGELAESINLWEAVIANNKDALATRTAYLLNLTGPANAINTACSTGLVAVVEACKNLQLGTCNMALAGGTAFPVSDDIGYLHQEGMIFSKDGHCRAFDADASGTISGAGVGVVLLKRLSDAIQDKDPIIAVIKGYASNNDGSRKTGYTAPSVTGQSECIINAQRMAGVTAAEIDYVECHGTATPLGDPIEVQALQHAFSYTASGSKRNDKTLLGSVKSNIGHTGAAAGVAGLIKVSAMLQHNLIPGQVNYRAPNPELRLSETPFEIVNENRVWLSQNQKPRIAGVSSFGIGGTNAHVIVSDYVPTQVNQSAISVKSDGDGSPVISLSAKSRTSLISYKKALCSFLSGKDNAFLLSDVAYTLNQRREHFNFRTALTVKTVEELISKLNTEESFEEINPEGSNRIVFMFAGQGVQYYNMARALYNNEPEFKKHIHECVDIANKYLETDLLDVMYTDSATPSGDIHEINRSPVSLFTIEYSLACYLNAMGVTADAYIGHSFGEYVAATLAGIFSLEDAIKTVIARGNLMYRMRTGSMIAINARAEDVRMLIEAHECDISVINSHEDIVASGTPENIQLLTHSLEQKNIPVVRINGNVAGHSRLMEQASKEFKTAFDKVVLNTPSKLIACNLTGTLDGATMCTSDYWCNQLRSPVQFEKGVEAICKHFNNQVTFIEVGVGRALGYFVNKFKNLKKLKTIQTVQLLPSAKELNTEKEFVVSTKADLKAKLWMSGVLPGTELTSGLSDGQTICGLPTYQFDSKSCWINSRNFSVSETERNGIIERFTRELSQKKTLVKEEIIDLLSGLLTNPRQEQEPDVSNLSGAILLEEAYSETELKVARVMAGVLGIEQLSLYDNFFKIGGNSILAIKVSHQLSEVLECEVKVADIFKYKSCGAIVENLSVSQVDVENVEKEF